MADTFDIGFLNELDGQFVSLARRVGQKNDREDRTNLRQVLLLAGAVAGLVVLAAVLALALSHAPKAGNAPTGAYRASRVPAVIPPQGVTVADTIVLKPPLTSAAHVISRDQVVRSLGRTTPPSVMVLAKVTVLETAVPETMPLNRSDYSAPGATQWQRVYGLPFDTHPGVYGLPFDTHPGAPILDTNPGSPIHDRIAWVVTYAFSERPNPRLFRADAYTEASPSPSALLVSPPMAISHRVVVVDAQTGDVIFEFSTP